MLKRQIESELVELILKRIHGNEPAQAAMKAKAFRPIMLYAARSLVGIREKTGNNDGREIELIQETVGGHSGEPYCIGGVQSVLAFAETVTGEQSPIPVTELATGLWNSAPKLLRVKRVPAPMAIAIWQDLDSKGKKKIFGHGELVESAASTFWNGIGFNTSGASYPGGPVIREGNGVYFTKRNYENTAKRILLGFLKPI